MLILFYIRIPRPQNFYANSGLHKVPHTNTDVSYVPKNNGIVNFHSVQASPFIRFKFLYLELQRVPIFIFNVALELNIRTSEL